MDTDNIVWEYWDAKLRTQSKRQLALLDKAVQQTGAIITDCHAWMRSLYKQEWRNALVLKIKLPARKRWEFILVSECTIWLAKPYKLTEQDCDENRRGNPTIYNSGYYDPLSIPLRGNHDNARIRRRYRLHPEHATYIADYRPDLNGGYDVIEGVDIVAAVLDGDLDLIL